MTLAATKDAADPARNPTTAGHFDVLIVGAGISGIDAAYHLKKHFPEKSYTVLETQDGFGGTWKTHTYPGIRSDSDLFTFGYKWKPWMSAPDRNRGRNPQIPRRGHRGGRSRAPHPLRSPGRARGLVQRGQVLEPDRAQRRVRRAGVHRGLFVDVPGLLSSQRGLHPGMARHGHLQGPDRTPANLARGSRLRGQARRRHRFRGDRRHPGAGHGGALRAHYPAAEITHLLRAGAEQERAGGHTA